MDYFEEYIGWKWKHEMREEEARVELRWSIIIIIEKGE